MGFKVVVALSALVSLSGCVQTQELALAKNVYQLEVSGQGWGAGAVSGSVQKKAAELTLSKGYTHFLLGNANLQSGSEFAGTTPMYATTYGGNTNFYGGAPIRRRTASASVTVAMYSAKNAPSNALDAAEILKASKK